MHHQLSAKTQACIDECLRCHTTCLSMVTQHCLPMGGAHADPTHVTIMLDCAQICATAADFMARGSAHHAHVCAECADICAACAQSCEQLDGMEACVSACRACETSCREMAAAMA